MKLGRAVRVFIVPFVILIAVFTIPKFDLQFSVSNLLTIVTFLFTIVVGFFIASATTNYLGLQSGITQEDAALIDIFNAGCYVQPSKRKNLAEAIDRYMIVCLEFDFSHYVMGTLHEFDQLIRVVNSIEPVSDTASSVIQNLHNDLYAITQARHTALLASRRVVKSVHWFILALLTLLIFVLLFVLRGESVLSNLLIGALAIVTYLLLVLLYDIDSNVFLEDVKSFIDVEPVFQTIGKPVYYPGYALRDNNFKPRFKKYRVGFHDSQGRLKIRLVH